MTTRRTILELLAASPLLASTQGCATSAKDADPIAAWRNPGAGQTDPRLFALAHAILAPNPHNRQPWLISLQGPSELSLYFDKQRRLPITDPYDRQLTIGCGAFLELLRIAAAEAGYTAKIQPFPEGFNPNALDARQVAHVSFTSGSEKDSLFSQIVKRRSNRETYDTKHIMSLDQVSQIIGSVAQSDLHFGSSLTGAETCEALRKLVIQAYRREIETPAALKESIDLMRIGKHEIAQYRDGISLDFPGIELLKLAGQITPEKLVRPGTMAYKQGLEMYDPLGASAAGFVWIISKDNERKAQLEAGRAYARLNLQATQLGLSMHPMSQSLQEYREVGAVKAQVEELVGLAVGQRLQMLARVGYGPTIAPAPRRGLDQNLRS